MPAALLEAERLCFTELRGFSLSGNDYEIADGDGPVVMRAESRLHLFRGWRYDFTVDGQTRFSMRRKTRLLLLDGLEVCDADGALLGAFHQRPTGFAVHFDVVDRAGALRFTVQQPSDVWTHFFAQRGAAALAEFDRAHRVWDGTTTQAVSVQDAFEVRLQEPADELDRVLLVAAGLFLDRLYFSRDDNSDLTR